MEKEHSSFIKIIESEIIELSIETYPDRPHRQTLVRAHWRQEFTANNPTQMS